MKRLFSLLLCATVLFTCCVFQTSAVNEEKFVPYVIDFSLTTPTYENVDKSIESRVSGLILSYGLEVSITSAGLKIRGETYCITDVVKSGFKNLVVQRRKNSSYSWSECYDFGNVYVETNAARLSTTLSVASGYQYRLSCKHYAKKSLLVTESISNTSGIVTVS